MRSASEPRITRRSLLGRASTLAAAGILGPSLVQCLRAYRERTRRGWDAHVRAQDGGYGPLQPVPDRHGNVLLALPPGFHYTTFGVTGTPMADGFPTPMAHDGMAAFPLPNGNVRLIRNHEDRNRPGRGTVLGEPSAKYDPRGGAGTTSLEVDPRTRELIRDFVSLTGTHANCAGGPTPWGSWLSCEETTDGITQGWERPHGYVFEVPAEASGPVTPEPLRALGRFRHEAVAVDPTSGIVYETEDNGGTSGFYRFVPHRPGDLAAGGRLQILAVRDRPNYWTGSGQRVGQPLPVTWIDIADPDPAAAETRPAAVFAQGAAEGAALFKQLEGCWYGGGSIYFTATAGGDAGWGQVWQYRPGTATDGELILIFESDDGDVLKGPDNLCLSPRGALVICEDSVAPCYLRGLAPDGTVFDLARNLTNAFEWAGATFSPDGDTLFVNLQGATSGPSRPGNRGMTFAIWGPWSDGAL